MLGTLCGFLVIVGLAITLYFTLRKRPVRAIVQFDPKNSPRPKIISLINYIGPILAKCSTKIATQISFDDGEELMQAAIDQLTQKELPNAKDFIADAFTDPLFLEAYDVLRKSFRTDGRFNFFGALGVRQELIRLLSNRLLISAALRQLQPLPPARGPPVFIIGLPRTGTTMLFHLLAMDCDVFRPLRMFEGTFPALPPSAVEGLRTGALKIDPRVVKQRQQLAVMDYLMPELQSIHPVGAELPEECVNLMMSGFYTLQLPVVYRVPSYMDWLRKKHEETKGNSTRAAYKYFSSLLRIVDEQLPTNSRRRWLLKSPGHLFCLDVLMETFPDALLLWTHRDPAAVVPSVASIICHLRSIGSDNVDPHEIGRHWSALARELLERGLAARERLSPEQKKRILDINYLEQYSDPVSIVKRVYDHIGLPLRPQTEAAISAWLKDNHPPSKPVGRGVHTYSHEQFGLPKSGAADVATEQVFRAYRERFCQKPTS